MCVSPVLESSAGDSLAAGHVEGRHDAVADVEVLDLGPDALDDAHELRSTGQTYADQMTTLMRQIEGHSGTAFNQHWHEPPSTQKADGRRRC